MLPYFIFLYKREKENLFLIEVIFASWEAELLLSIILNRMFLAVNHRTVKKAAILVLQRIFEYGAGLFKIFMHLVKIS